jgi:peptidoglycan/LPS O-acetylase OafA/YrhL
VFGIYRFVLAAAVMLAHLGGGVSSWSGGYAVFSFYLLSGYLMSLVLTKTYGFTLDGTRRFLVNRFLRIYPVYYAAFVLALVVILALPATVLKLNPALRVPTSGVEWFHNVAIFGLMDDVARCVPPAWSLYVELVFYLAMGLVLARHRAIVTVWFIASLAYTVTLLAVQAPFADRYYPPLAASLPFSLGAMVFFYGDSLRFRSVWPVGLAGLLYLGNFVFTGQLWGDPLRFGVGFYVQLALAAFVTAGLAKVSLGPTWLKRLDRAAGDLAYPLFVCHYHVGAVVFRATGEHLEHVRTGQLFVTTLPLAVVTAWVIHRSVERAVNRVRDRVRASPRDAPAVGAVPEEPRHVGRAEGGALAPSLARDQVAEREPPQERRAADPFVEHPPADPLRHDRLPDRVQ